jgi:hypothetical protein
VSETLPHVRELAAVALSGPALEPPAAPAAPEWPDGPESLSAFISGPYLAELEAYLSAMLPEPDMRAPEFDFWQQRLVSIELSSRSTAARNTVAIAKGLMPRPPKLSDAERAKREREWREEAAQREREYWQEVRDDNPGLWLDMQVATHEPALVEPLTNLRAAAGRKWQDRKSFEWGQPRWNSENPLAKWVAARDQAASVKRNFDLGLADRAARNAAYKTRQEHLPTALELGQRAHKAATTVVAELSKGTHPCQQKTRQ